MNLDDITVLVIACNEEPNIGRCLEALQWAHRIVLLDSGSTDRTLEIAATFPNTQVLHRAFDTFANQCNHGLEHINSTWVLSLDADYITDETFRDELRALEPRAEAYRAAFTYCINGRPLRKCLLPPRTVLYRKACARYEDDGHGHRVRTQGNTARLGTCIKHDDRKPLHRWLHSQLKYAAIEADKLTHTPHTELGFPDKIRKKIILAPWLVPLHCYIIHGLVLDGRHGLFYALQRGLAEMLLALHLLERKLPGKREEART